ncbi:MAG: ABC transporter substrate-binding protein [Actinobacteria bacterium]|nr:ABC transporter substrate-binding protein [Actinomycetota bacterium]
MRADSHPLRATSGLAALLVVGALIAGCTPTTVPTQSPTATATPRNFTVLTTGEITTADPAVATGDTDSIVVTSLYQRLMVVLPGTGELKPDAATDCLFTSNLVYACTLPDTLKFQNGNVLDSSDVKFSIQRALRLDTPGSSVLMLSALKRIVTPDAHTVRFELSWPDNQFGFALAGQAAGIVDEQTFGPDTPLPLAQRPIGSGPYSVDSISGTAAVFTKYTDYVGAKAGLLSSLTLSIAPDSVAAEEAIAKGTADVVWRSLDNAALQRVDNEIAGSTDKATAKGFTAFPLPGLRVTQVVWNADSKLRRNADLREGVSKALQPDRTLDSIVPVGVTDHASAFALGGRPKLPKLDGDRIYLTLGYSPSAPGHADLASILRDRIEELDGVSVRLVTSGSADLWLTDQPAWVDNAIGWLQRYLTDPLPGSKNKLDTLTTRARTTTGTARTATLTELQQQAAADATVLPVSQADGIMFVAKGVTLVGEPFGSGQVLGLWGITRG